ncbi:MAG: hypothetical protein R2713_19735 [Ilumatobacteraceae bacterium]
MLVIAQGRLAATGDYRDLRELMDDRPHRVRITASDARRLATRLVADGLIVAVARRAAPGGRHARRRRSAAGSPARDRARRPPVRGRPARRGPRVGLPLPRGAPMNALPPPSGPPMGPADPANPVRPGPVPPRPAPSGSPSPGRHVGRWAATALVYRVVRRQLFSRGRLLALGLPRAAGARRGGGARCERLGVGARRGGPHRQPRVRRGRADHLARVRYRGDRRPRARTRRSCTCGCARSTDGRSPSAHGSPRSPSSPRCRWCRWWWRQRSPARQRPGGRDVARRCGGRRRVPGGVHPVRHRVPPGDGVGARVHPHLGGVHRLGRHRRRPVRCCAATPVRCCCARSPTSACALADHSLVVGVVVPLVVAVAFLALTARRLGRLDVD